MKKVIYTFLVATVLASFSIFLPVKVETREEMKTVKLGFPFPFVTQNISGLSWGESDSAPLPRRTGFMSPWEDSFHVSKAIFIIDVIIIWVLILLIIYLLYIHRGREGL